MGLFDTIRCDYPLPNPADNARTFQIKQFGALCEQYHIAADGTLTQRRHDAERFDPFSFTGEFTFYTHDGNGRWVEYVARAECGVVREVRRGKRDRNRWSVTR